MNKYFSMIRKFSIFLILWQISQSSFAYDFEVDDIYYKTTSLSKVEVAKGYYSGSVIIPEYVTYEGYTFNVTSIGNYAFEGCYGLISITIPESVTSIGDYAFYGCIGLKTVINCSSLDISAGSSDHGNVAYYADKVVNVDGQIGDFFFYKTTLTGYVGNQIELALPEDYNDEKYMIGNSAFRDNTNLTSVFIPASVTGIEENAFDGCGNLASLTMASPVPPASVYENSFGTINYIYTTLYVPEGSLAAYQTANVWKYFMKIKEYDPTGIEDVVLDTESSNLPNYNLQGVRMKDVDSLPSGIYIQGGKKFVVK